MVLQSESALPAEQDQETPTAVFPQDSTGLENGGGQLCDTSRSYTTAIPW